MWSPVSNYLDKFFKIAPPGKPGEFYRQEISKIIKENLNMEINPDDIDCRWGNIHIKTKNNAVKNEIFINKAKIIKILDEKFKNNQLKEIRFN